MLCAAHGKHAMRSSRTRVRSLMTRSNVWCDQTPPCKPVVAMFALATATAVIGAALRCRCGRCDGHLRLARPHRTGSAAHGDMFTAMPLILSQVDEEGCCLVVTTGGTGPAPRDVTPEATEAVCSRMLPGYGEQMRALGLRYVPTAVLSRQTAGALVTLWPTKHRTH